VLLRALARAGAVGTFFVRGRVGWTARLGGALIVSASIIASCNDSLATPPVAPSDAERTPAGSVRIFRDEYTAVWRTLVEVLKENGETVSAADRKLGLLSTDKRFVGNEQLAAIAEMTTNQKAEAEGGWYTLAIRVRASGERRTRVSIESLMVGSSPQRDNTLGGFPLRSRGVVERSLLDATGLQLRQAEVSPMSP